MARRILICVLAVGLQLSALVVAARPAAADIRSHIVGLARAEVGVGEPGCDKYRDPASGLNCAGGSIAWCAMFAKWLWAQAGFSGSLPPDNTARGLGSWGASQDLFKTSGPEPGDWVIYGTPAAGAVGGHVDIVVSVNSNGTLTVIGGNVSNRVTQRTINPSTATGGTSDASISGYVEPTRAGSRPPGQWSGWIEEGGPVTAGPDVAAWASRRLDVFARTDTGQLVQKYHYNGTWYPSTTFPEQIVGDPSVVSTGVGRLDVFYLGTDNQIHYRYFRANTDPRWSDPFVPVPGQVTSPPDVASWAGDRLDVFARGPQGTLVHGWLEVVNGERRWRGWEDLGHPIVGAPGAVSWGDGRIDVVFRGTDNHLKQIFYSRGNGFSGVRDLGGTITAPPDIASWGPGRLDIVVQATDGTIRQRYFTNGQWNPGFVNLGGTTVTGSGPSITAWGPRRLDIFVRASGNALYHRYFS